jgi:UDP-glucuronate decarboxylase
MNPNSERVVSNYIAQALKGEEISICGTGQQTRSFCYVDDLIDGFIRMMQGEPGFTGPVNIGNHCEFTIIKFAKKIIKLVGRSRNYSLCRYE